MKSVVECPRWFMLTMVLGLLVSLGAGAAALAPVAPDVKPLDPTLIQQADTLSLAFQQAAEHIGPSVVSITSEKRFTVQGRQGSPQIPEEFRRFFGDDFGRFFETPSEPRNGVQRGFGSGVIVSPDGFILTNNHVVAEADALTVKMGNDDTFDAEVIGRDEKSDIALIKVDASGLPAAALGDSDAARVGQWVIAVGGPFGLENTVTSGIISATGRDAVGIADYENFLQTDAAINPGNSGGPLVNLHGEVIGINTAIASRTGSNAGVGFSIPINMARQVMQSLKETGRVDRGYIGALIQNLTKDLAQSFSYKGTDGVLIGDVTEDGPAEKAGLKSGDIVTKLNGRPVGTSSQFRNRIAATKPNTAVTLEVFRDGQLQNFRVTVGLLDDKVIVSSEGDASSSTDLGLTVRTLTAQMAEELGYTSGLKGVVVTDVDPVGIAASAGLRPKDVIVSVNNDRVEDADKFREALQRHDPKQGLRLLVRSEGFSRFVFLKTR